MRYFVIRGFGTKHDGEGRPFDFEAVDRGLIAPALAQCGFEGGTTGRIQDSGSIHEDMFALILEADVVVCDITVHNANVFYELGIRHALRKRRTVLIRGEPSADRPPFDIAGFRYLAYPADNPAAAVPGLVEALRQGQASERDTDSPVFRALPGLPEAEPDGVSLTPREFVERVGRAREAQDTAALQVLAQDARALRYPWAGLALVARAQSQLKALEPARASWEALRAVNDFALEAELALGNVYERLSRGAAEPARVDLLTRSNQALQAALARPDIDRARRAEALSQQARNLKTLWRLEWEPLPGAAARLEHAVHPRALQSWDGYLAAFELDLNAFYSGLAALQMGRLLLHLAQQPGWGDLHDSAEAAEQRRAAIEQRCAALEPVVIASIDRARALEQGEALMWAEISRVDALFLSVPEPEGAAAARRVGRAYGAAVPREHRFARDAALSQLRLFQALDFRAVLAAAAIRGLTPDAAAPG